MLETQLQSQTITNETTCVADSSTYQDFYVFVVQFLNGKYGVGTSNKPYLTIASINSGKHPLIKDKLTIHRVVGVKEQTEDRNLINTVKRISERAGIKNTIAL